MTADKTGRRRNWEALVVRKAGYVRIAVSMKEEVLVSSKRYQMAHSRWRSSRIPARIEVLGFDSRVDNVVDMNC